MNRQKWSLKLFQREQRSLFGEILDWMLTPLLLRTGLAGIHGDNLADTPYAVPDGLLHWLDLAGHANAMADKLAAGIAALGSIRLAWPSEANEVFAILPEARRDQLRTRGVQFLDWADGALPEGEGQ